MINNDSIHESTDLGGTPDLAPVTPTPQLVPRPRPVPRPIISPTQQAAIDAAKPRYQLALVRVTGEQGNVPIVLETFYTSDSARIAGNAGARAIVLLKDEDLKRRAKRRFFKEDGSAV